MGFGECWQRAQPRVKGGVGVGGWGGGTSTKAALSENAGRPERGSPLARGRASALSGSFLWEYIMARAHVCQLQDKLKQDVSARGLL